MSSDGYVVLEVRLLNDWHIKQPRDWAAKHLENLRAKEDNWRQHMREQIDHELSQAEAWKQIPLPELNETKGWPGTSTTVNLSEWDAPGKHTQQPITVSIDNTETSASTRCWERNFKKTQCEHQTRLYSPQDECRWCRVEQLQEQPEP